MAKPMGRADSSIERLKASSAAQLQRYIAPSPRVAKPRRTKPPVPAAVAAAAPVAPAVPVQSPTSRATAALGRAWSLSRRLDRAGNWVIAGTAARQGFERAAARGASPIEAAAAGVRDAAVPLAFASAPLVARVAGAGSERAIAAAKVAINGHAAANSAVLRAGLTAVANSANEVGAVLRGVQAVARFAPLVGVTLGAVRGARDDDNRLRGALRGAATSYDPTAIVMGRGVVERGFDAMFGRSVQSSQRAALRDNRSRLAGRHEIETGPRAQASQHTSVQTYQRTYTRGPKAGTTEVVHRS